VIALNRPAWPGFTAKDIQPSSFCARRKMLRSRPRLKPSTFCLRQGMLASEGPRLNFDGSLSSLFALYREHLGSPWHRLGRSARNSYGSYLNGIAREHGHHRVAWLTEADMLNWCDRWSAPIGIDPERLAGAQVAKRALRNALKFGAALGLKGCAELVQHVPLPRWHR
jgi:hypothetical protein